MGLDIHLGGRGWGGKCSCRLNYETVESEDNSGNALQMREKDPWPIFDRCISITQIAEIETTATCKLITQSADLVSRGHWFS